MQTTHKRSYTLIALGALATIGLMEGARGVILPHFLSDLELGPGAGAAVFSSGALGYLATSLSFGALTQRFGLRRVALSGLLLGGIALSLFLTLRNPALLYLVNILVGAGFSMLELSTSLPISLLHSERQGGMLNLLHGCFGAGALAGSLWAVLWLGLGTGWRTPLGLAALILLLWGLWFATLPALAVPRPAPGTGGFGPLLRDPLVWTAAGALTAAVVAEVGVGLWLLSFLQQEKGLAEEASALAITTFYIGFTLTRLGAATVINRLGEVRSIYLLAVVGATGLTTLLLLPGKWAWLAAFAGVGVAVGFATCVALVAVRYPDRVDRVYAIMYSCGGLAGILTPPVMGWIGGRAGLTAAMGLPLGAYATILILMLLHGAMRKAAQPVSG